MPKSIRHRPDASATVVMARLRTEMMTSNVFLFESEIIPPVAKDGVWVFILTLASIAFSFGFACATPFAALCALAGTQMRRGAGLVLIAAGWFESQLIGFAFLSYPRTWDSFGWGAAIGVAALLATITARTAATRVRSPLMASLLAFATAFAVYQGVLFAATAILPSCVGAFSLPVMTRGFGIEGGAFIGLLVIQRFAVSIGLQREARSLRPAL